MKLSNRERNEIQFAQELAQRLKRALSLLAIDETQAAIAELEYADAVCALELLRHQGLRGDISPTKLRDAIRS